VAEALATADTRSSRARALMEAAQRGLAILGDLEGTIRAHQAAAYRAQARPGRCRPPEAAHEALAAERAAAPLRPQAMPPRPCTMLRRPFSWRTPTASPQPPRRREAAKAAWEGRSRMSAAANGLRARVRRCAMLLDVSDHTDQFLQQAEECRQRAASAPNDDIKASWLQLAGEYLKAAQSCNKPIPEEAAKPSAGQLRDPTKEQFDALVKLETTYIPMTRDHDFMRHIYTDGRDFPANMTVEPGFLGYSIGKWIDTDGDGRYDTLEVETRGMKGPRVFDASGIPLHEDNETIIQERIYLDKADKNLLHDDITTIDHALTRPWRVTQTFRRIVSDKPLWFGHEVCGEGNAHVGIGKEIYYLSGDGLLMPAMKDQPPPDLRYFKKCDR
jgi:hypothetical protein